MLIEYQNVSYRYIEVNIYIESIQNIVSMLSVYIDIDKVDIHNHHIDPSLVNIGETTL